MVVEAALLVEAGWSSLVDEIWVTCSEEGEVLERLRGRNSLSESEIRDRNQFTASPRRDGQTCPRPGAQLGEPGGPTGRGEYTAA